MILVIAGGVAAVGLVGASLRGPSKLFPRRTNFRGWEVIATGGVALLAGCLVSIAFDFGPTVRHLAPSLAVATIAVLGLIDDLYGDRSAGGFRGHLKSLRAGKITTGLTKAVGGGLVGIAFAITSGKSGIELVVAAGVVAMSANAFNLLDLRPGRALKVWMPLAVAIALLWDDPLVWATLGAAAVVAPFDLKEKLMLGDVGANLLGACIGVALVANATFVGLTVALAIVSFINLASEFVSFSAIIDGSPLLRRLDQIGRDS